MVSGLVVSLRILDVPLISLTGITFTETRQSGFLKLTTAKSITNKEGDGNICDIIIRSGGCSSIW